LALKGAPLFCAIQFHVIPAFAGVAFLFSKHQLTNQGEFMSLNHITEQVNNLGTAWEQFKQVNDRRLSDIERKGNADPLYAEHLSKIGHALGHHKTRMDSIETAVSRPSGAIEVPHLGTKSGGGQYTKAFTTYLRKGMDSGLEQIESKALSVGSDPDGGYTVTPAMSETIVKAIAESSPMRQLCNVENISTDALEIIQDYNEQAAGWTTETGSISDSATPQIAKKVISVHELYAQPKATQKLVDDSAIDIEQWLSEKVSEVFTRLENKSFIDGDGSGKPKGILDYTAGTSWGEIEQIDSGVDGALTADSLIKLYYSLNEEYSSRATFLMNRSVVQAARLLKESTTDQYLWNPGLAAGADDTLLGVPVRQAADMPVAAGDSLSVAIADFKRAYTIVDRIGIRTLRDPFTDKPFIKFYTTKRVGGDVVNFDAIKLLKLAA